MEQTLPTTPRATAMRRHGPFVSTLPRATAEPLGRVDCRFVHMTVPSRRVAGRVVLAAALLVAVAVAGFERAPQDRRPAAHADSAPEVTAAAPPISADYALGTSPITLPPRCRPQPVEELVLGLLQAFNDGDTHAFAARFVRPSFHPYPSQVAPSGFIDRDAIEGFVRDRHVAGDGWALRVLQPPVGRVGLPHEAIYTAEVRVVSRGREQRAGGGVKLVVDCRSGLVAHWLGPRDGPPGAAAWS